MDDGATQVQADIEVWKFSALVVTVVKYIFLFIVILSNMNVGDSQIYVFSSKNPDNDCISSLDLEPNDGEEDVEDVGAEQENDRGQNGKGWHSCHLVAEQTRYPGDESCLLVLLGGDNQRE